VGVIRLTSVITTFAVDPRTDDVIATVRGKVDAPGRVLIVDARVPNQHDPRRR